jgi:Kef-type K+ transport system membrane component KefB
VLLFDHLVGGQQQSGRHLDPERGGLNLVGSCPVRRGLSTSWNVPRMDKVSTVNLIAVSVVMAVAAGIPALLPRLPVPGVVLEIVLGAIIGPQLLGIVHPAVTLNFLANFGLGMLFLMAGFEMDPSVLRGRPLGNALTGWAVTAIVAIAASMLLFFAGVAEAPILTALAVSTTTIGALLPMLRDAGLLGPPYGPMVLAAGAIGEAAPVIALSLVLARDRAPLQALIMLAFAAGAAGAVVLAARASGGHFAAIVARTMGTSGQLPMRLAICLLILLVVLSERLQIDLVVGAFVAGAVIRAALQHHHHEAFAARLDGLGSAFLVPIFFCDLWHTPRRRSVVLRSRRADDGPGLCAADARGARPACAAALSRRPVPQPARRPRAAFGNAAIAGCCDHQYCHASRSHAWRPGRGLSRWWNPDRDPVSGTCSTPSAGAGRRTAMTPATGRRTRNPPIMIASTAPCKVRIKSA